MSVKPIPRDAGDRGGDSFRESIGVCFGEENEMSNAVAKQETESNIRIIQPSAVSAMEQVIIEGNLASLEPIMRARYYLEVCQSIGVNPLTQPFGYVEIDGVLMLYAKKDCTDQLRKIHNVTIDILGRELVDGVYIVTARSTLPNGRTDESIGAVPMVKEDGEWEDVLGKNGQKVEDGKWPDGRVKFKRKFVSNGKQTPLTPEQRANAMMKCETKAKRRVTLSSVGLGITDESELATIASARIVEVNQATGKIMGSKAVAIEAGPTASAETPAGENGSAPELTWTVFWRMLGERGIDGPAYESVVGAKAPSFPSPQAALNALRETENGAGDEPAPDEQPDVIDIDGQQVDARSGEIVNEPEPAPAPEKPAKKPVAEFGKPAPVADRYTQ